MHTTRPHSKAQRLGRALARLWRSLVRQDRRTAGWLVQHGLNAGAAQALLWLARLVVLGLLLYAAVWLALLLLFAIVAAWAARDMDNEGAEWAIGDQAEHKKNPGYDPILHHDAPDSRYVDPRYDDN